MNISTDYKTLPPEYRRLHPLEDLGVGTEFLLFYNPNNVSNQLYTVAGFVEYQIVIRYPLRCGGWVYETHPYSTWVTSLKGCIYVKGE